MSTCSSCNGTGTMTASGLPCVGCGPPTPPPDSCLACAGQGSGLHTCNAGNAAAIYGGVTGPL